MRDRTARPAVFLALAIMAFASAAQAVTIEENAILNTSVSNSSVTFSVETSFSEIVVERTYIYMEGISYNDGSQESCASYNHTAENTNIDSASLCPPAGEEAPASQSNRFAPGSTLPLASGPAEENDKPGSPSGPAEEIDVRENRTLEMETGGNVTLLFNGQRITLRMLGTSDRNQTATFEIDGETVSLPAGGSYFLDVSGIILELELTEIESGNAFLSVRPAQQISQNQTQEDVPAEAGEAENPWPAIVPALVAALLVCAYLAYSRAYPRKKRGGRAVDALTAAAARETKKARKSRETALRKEVAGLRKSLASLKDDIQTMNADEVTDELGMEMKVSGAMEDINRRISAFSRKADRAFSQLNEKMEDIEQEKRQAISSPMEDLGEELSAIRSELKGLVKKQDVLSIAGQPAARNKGKAPKGTDRPGGPEAVKVSRLREFSGKEIEVECRLRLAKVHGGRGGRAYWYDASDGSGKSILVSGRKLPDGKNRIRCIVKKTASGNYYMQLAK